MILLPQLPKCWDYRCLQVSNTILGFYIFLGISAVQRAIWVNSGFGDFWSDNILKQY
jgi:hypothetical protein